ncbi:MAG TPA: hypothetical protein VIG69_12060 [Candidatus Methylomirabilis sp.]
MVLAHDHRISAEQRDVRRRPEFGFRENLVGDLLECLWRTSESVHAPSLLRRLPDPADAMFVEATAAASPNGS